MGHGTTSWVRLDPQIGQFLYEEKINKNSKNTAIYTVFANFTEPVLQLHVQQ